MTFLPCAAAPSGLLAYLRGMVPRPSFGSYGLSALEFLDLVPSRPDIPQQAVAAAFSTSVPGAALEHAGGRRAISGLGDASGSAIERGVPPVRS